MTPRELAAFRAGIAHAASQAQIAAIAIEIRADAGHIRQQAAIAALRGLAEGLKQQAGSEEETHSDRPPDHGAATPAAVPPSERRHASIAAGFTGDTCDACGSSEMKRSGTCMTCQVCGATTGCG